MYLASYKRYFQHLLYLTSSSSKTGCTGQYFALEVNYVKRISFTTRFFFFFLIQKVGRSLVQKSLQPLFLFFGEWRTNHYAASPMWFQVMLSGLYLLAE